MEELRHRIANGITDEQPCPVGMQPLSGCQSSKTRVSEMSAHSLVVRSYEVGSIVPGRRLMGLQDGVASQVWMQFSLSCSILL